MRIPLDFTSEKDRVSVIATVKFPPKNIPLPIKFVVDTGAPETFVDEIDATKFRIFAKNYPLSNSMLLAGTKIDLHNIGKVILNFRNESGNLETMEFSSLKIAESAWTRPGAVSAGTSILGMNFLLENKLHLFVDPDKGIAYIGRD